MNRKAFVAGFTLIASAAVGARAQGPGSRGTVIDSGTSCPPGTTEIRPRRCQAPEFPAPSILDYRPRSTLVVPAHPVAKAKFPAIDFHGHLFSLMNAQGFDSVIKSLDQIGVKTIVVADNNSGDRLTRAIALANSSPKYKGRIRFLTGINFNNVGPGWAETAIKQLDADVAAGAVGVGEIGKQVGRAIVKADGSRLKIDDPDLDPIWEECARLKIPVFIHTADPQPFYNAFDFSNERWLEMALYADRRLGAESGPKFDDLMAERDNMVKKHPRTIFVVAHMSWYANDLGRLGKLFDANPNVYTEVGAVLYDIGRQPREARDFFIKYQDRILFGKDSFQPEEYPYYWRVFETKDDYFDYYRNYHAFWKLYGIDLPDAVLKKLYADNALRITPALSRN
jgi:predicted TIM-barrel fold metal-dependent hydrolase